MSENISDPAPYTHEDAPKDPNAISSAPVDASHTDASPEASREDTPRDMPQPQTPSNFEDPRRVWVQRPGEAPQMTSPSESPEPAPQGAPSLYAAEESQEARATWESGASFPLGSAGAPQMPTTSASPHKKRRSIAPKKGPSWFALILAMVLTAIVSLGGAWVMLENRPTARATVSASSSQSAKTNSTSVTPVAPSGDSPDWKAVAQAVSPAVVTINVSTASASDVGSGVVYDASGDIVTNYHVISEAEDGKGQILVTLADGRIYDADVVGADQTTDLAVIRVENAPADLTVASFSSSSDLAVGQEVMAVGAPLGLSNTVTTGIISALNRPVEVSTGGRQSHDIDPNDPFGQLPKLRKNQTANSESVITNAIQVDASINPGNSGGPLFDSAGKVIGINSSIASNTSSSQTAGSIGLGFAIPVDLVTSVANQLIETGKVDHAMLGVSVTTGAVVVDDSRVAGAKVVGLSPRSAAAEAGIRSGDVIIAVNGETVSSSKQLTGYIRRYTDGDEVTITYVRDGQRSDVQVRLVSDRS